MIETQATVTAWQREAFRLAEQPTTLARVVARANTEMAELIAAAARAGTPAWDQARVLEESADVVILLYLVAELLGAKLHDVVDAKMAVNRSRRWIREPEDKGGGTYHAPGPRNLPREPAAARETLGRILYETLNARRFGDAPRWTGRQRQTGAAWDDSHEQIREDWRALADVAMRELRGDMIQGGGIDCSHKSSPVTAVPIRPSSGRR